MYGGVLVVTTPGLLLSGPRGAARHPVTQRTAHEEETTGQDASIRGAGAQLEPESGPPGS